MPGLGRLLLHRGLLSDLGRRAACNRLIHDVLGVTAVGHDAAADPWRAFAYFAPDGGCVANVDVAILPLVVDGDWREAGAIRSVAVDPAWRGRGLFRNLMTEALAWCEAKSSGPTLLYTEDQDLYRRFGFHGVGQHAFVGAAPRMSPSVPVRKLLPTDTEDAIFLRNKIERRPPVSMQCALLVDASQFAANLTAHNDLQIAYDAEHDAVIVYESDDDLLTIADVVAPTIPDMAAIVGALNLSPRRIKTLFPPDQLRWSGASVAEDTGLMMRGAVPPAMTRPFMFPPTAEF